MSKSKCGFCNATLKSGEWILINTENGVVKACNDRRMCATRCVQRGKSLLSMGLHKDVKDE